LQIANLTYACGNNGDPSRMRLTFTIRSNPYLNNTDTSTSTFQVRFGSDVFMSTPLRGPVGSTDAIATFFNTTTSPATHTARNFTMVLLDIPCARINSTTLSFVHIATGQDVEYFGPSIQACVVETCGGQNIVCPGLKPFTSCTPGYDCMLCDMFALH
jgi:hypothetical protein